MSGVRRSGWERVVGPLLVLLLALFAPTAQGQATYSNASTTPQSAAATSATYVGEKTCITCHGQENTHYTNTTHAKAFRLNPRNEREAQVCEACHGPGSAHAQSPKDKTLIVGFTKGWGTPVDTQANQCLSCHKGGNRLHWPSSVHQTNQLSCSDCHNPMQRASEKGLLVRPTIVETCLQCHRQQGNEFRKRSHMPVLEGKMSCEDCHNPHGSVTPPLLKAESVNVVCYQCHAEKRGPFIWEHAPVRESCLNCHNPHGSNQEKLLIEPRPYLCQKCHDVAVGHPGMSFRKDQNVDSNLKYGFAPSDRVVGRACQNCHTQIHGSNSPAGARWQR